MRPVTFFIDRSMGERQVPAALRDAGWVIVTMAERYGRQAGEDKQDPDWIRDASDLGEAIITKDKMIAERPIEAQTIHLCDARVFASSPATLRSSEMIVRLLRNEAAIPRWSTRHGPYVAAVREQVLGRVRLNYP